MESRRSFLKASAAGLAMSGSILGANDRVRMAVIGTGMRGTQVHGSFIKHKDVQFVVACDVAKDRLDTFLTANKDEKLETSGDYRKVFERKDIDAVLLTVPDHWHEPMLKAALEAGKDVYVEKPISNTVEGALKMLQEAQSHKQVIQVGLQQRSWDHFQECAKMVRDGQLGKVTHAVMQYNSSYFNAAPQGQPVPSTLDWKMWLGSAPEKSYSFQRQRSWRSFYDYGGGIVTDWGVHLWDVADWYMDADNKVPKSVSASGQYVKFPADPEQVPDAVIVTAQYDNFVASFTNVALPNPDFELWGNYFFTDRGCLLVNRTGYMIRSNPTRRAIPGFPEPPKPLDGKQFKNPQGMSEDPNSTFASATMNHARNFLDCVKSRAKTVCPMEVGFHSTLPCLLGLESMKRGGKAVTFDGQKVVEV